MVEGPGRPEGWTPPGSWRRITTVDAHTAGEPFRVITSGVPEPPGATILERRRWAREKLDSLRRALMWEPRGHADMYGCIVTPPERDDADLGVLFLHNEGFSTMCGHGIIGLATVLLETGMRPAREPETTLEIDTPAGPVAARARVERQGGRPGIRVPSVAFRNVPSFVAALDETVDVPGVGEVRYDLAFGGAFYAFVDAPSLGLECVPGEVDELVRAGMAIKRAVMAARPVEHPFEEDLGFLYGTIFVGPPRPGAAPSSNGAGVAERSRGSEEARRPEGVGAPEGVHSRNVCVFADGEVDRSPTGTGLSARMAIHHARGEVRPGEPLVVESVLGTRFTGKVLETTRFGDHPAVVPEVEGSAHIVGRSEFLLDPDDPLRDGFLLR